MMRLRLRHDLRDSGLHLTFKAINTLSGAVANFMTETLAELMGHDPNYILSTADITRMSTALAIHLMNLDVNTAIHTSTLALENNFFWGPVAVKALSIGLCL
jgi:hypothetical protein